MIKIVALIGKAGSGKDTILRQVLQQAPEKFHKIISCTTRPPRENESDGVNYFFVSEEEFKDKIKSSDLLEYSCFNNWFYGTSINTLSTEKPNIGIFSLSSCDYILKHCYKEVSLKPYYVIASDKTRLIRQLIREKDPNIDEIIRRFLADKEDFRYLEDHQIFYRSFFNEQEKDIRECVNLIIADNFE